jgi:hypothetical protein
VVAEHLGLAADEAREDFGLVVVALGDGELWAVHEDVLFYAVAVEIEE